MKHTLKILLFLTSLFILVYSCKKENDNSSSSGMLSSGSGTMTTTITGRAIDESNNAISNASVVINGQTTATDQNGIFVLKNISTNSRCIASITKTGFFNCNHAFIAKPNTVNYIKVVLISNAQTNTISSGAGGTVSLTDGSSILFAPNSFVNASTGSTYSGTVYLSVKHLSPDAANFGFMIPGGDLLGKSAAGNDVALYTYGMLGAELKGSSGEQLQLKTGTMATLTMAIASSQTATAPSSIPLWYFDETTSLWKEEGSASRVGNNYVGTVAHFSWWNCDGYEPCATILGKVLDCNGIPMPNVVVTVNGWATLVTNQGGVYSNLVPAGMPLIVHVLASNNQNFILNSQIENVPALSVNQTYIVPDLIVPCPAYISGNLKKCSGENVDGIISAIWAGDFTYQYSSNGNFNLVCLPSSSININASAYYDTSFFSYSGQYLSPASGNINNIGNLLLCNQVSASPNNLTIDGGPFSNRHFVIDTTNAYASLGSTFVIQTYGSTQGYLFSFYGIQLSSTLIGNYQWASSSFSFDIYINMSNGPNSYTIYATTTAGNTTLTYSGNIGDRVIGNFSGTAALSSSDSLYMGVPVTISGNFNVIRQ